MPCTLTSCTFAATIIFVLLDKGYVAVTSPCFLWPTSTLSMVIEVHMNELCVWQLYYIEADLFVFSFVPFEWITTKGNAIHCWRIYRPNKTLSHLAGPMFNTAVKDKDWLKRHLIVDMDNGQWLLNLTTLSRIWMCLFNCCLIHAVQYTCIVQSFRIVFLIV